MKNLRTREDWRKSCQVSGAGETAGADLAQLRRLQARLKALEGRPLAAGALSDGLFSPFWTLR